MPNFLLGIEYNLETMLFAATVSFLVSAILIWLIMAASSKSRLNQLRTTLEKEITSAEQQQMQLAADLNNLQQKYQQTELKISEQSTQIETLEQDKQAAQTQAERALVLESSLNQKNQEFAQLTQHLQDAENKLENLQQSLETKLVEKDAAINSLTTALDEQKSLLSQLEQSFQIQQAELAEQAKTEQQQLEQSLQQLQAEFSQLQQANLDLQQQSEKTVQQLQTELADVQQSKLEQQQQSEQTLLQLQTELAQSQKSKLEQQQQLEGSVLQVERLEQRLADRTAKSTSSAKPTETLELQQAVVRLQESNQALEKALSEKTTQIEQLQAGLTTGDTGQKPGVQEAKIAELNSALAEKANYIFRLEYDLEVKKALLSDKNSPLTTIPKAILAKQEQADARIIELEKKLNPKQKAVKTVVEKAQPKPSELLNPAKQQMDEIADKAKHLPDQMKGFYQKLLPKKTEQTPPLKASQTLDTEKAQPKNHTQAEQITATDTDALAGLKGFFKKLDKQAEATTPAKPTPAKPEQPKQSEKTTTTNTDSLSGLKGFFKKLDKQAEVSLQSKLSESISSQPEKQSPTEEVATKKGGVMGFFKK